MYLSLPREFTADRMGNMAMKEKIAGIIESKTVLELIAGILAYAFLCQIIGLFFVTETASYSAGLWIGTAAAVFSAIHMWWTLDTALDYDEKTAQKKMSMHNIIRYLVIVIILGLLMTSRAGNPLAAFLGIMGLKVAAYIQPFTHKLCTRFFATKLFEGDEKGEKQCTDE